MTEDSVLDLLLLPLAAPIRGFVFLLEQIRAATERELYDEQYLHQRLLELQMARELGDIDADTFADSYQSIQRRLDRVADPGRGG